MELWQKIKSARKSAGLTQEEVAKRFNPPISRAAISLWETSNKDTRTSPTYENLKEFAQIVGVAVSELLDNDTNELTNSPENTKKIRPVDTNSADAGDIATARRINMLVLVSMTGTAQELSQKTGISEDTINNLKFGSRPCSDDEARQIERGCQLESGWLDLDHEIAGNVLIGPGFGTTQIPQYDATFHGGPGAINDGDVDIKGHLYFKESWIQREGLNERNLLTVYVRGDSMAPRIQSGDTVVVNTDWGGKLRDDKVYALLYGDDARVKRVFLRADGSIELVSDSVGRPGERISRNDINSLSILGIVVHVSGSI